MAISVVAGPLSSSFEGVVLDLSRVCGGLDERLSVGFGSLSPSRGLSFWSTVCVSDTVVGFCRGPFRDLITTQPGISGRHDEPIADGLKLSVAVAHHATRRWFGSSVLIAAVAVAVCVPMEVTHVGDSESWRLQLFVKGPTEFRRETEMPAVLLLVFVVAMHVQHVILLVSQHFCHRATDV